MVSPDDNLIADVRNGNAVVGGNHNFTATTITLLWVSFYLIFTTLPVAITFAIQTFIPTGDQMENEQMIHDPVWQRFFTYYTVR